jgi:membrane protein
MSHLRNILRDAFDGFKRHNAPRLGAALAYYTVLSLSPLMILVLAIVGAVLGPEAARGEITTQLNGMIGNEGAKAVEAMITSANEPKHGILATIIGIAVLIVSATGVFIELKGSLDTIWETKIESKGWGIRQLIFDRVVAFMVICGIAFLLLVSLLFSALLAALSHRLGLGEEIVARIANCIISFLLTAGMFAIIFRLLPAKRPSWRQVLLGSLVTSLLFIIGKGLIGMYLGRAAVGSAYGAAGSLVVLLVWVYYSTQIFFFGAEITRASAAAQALQYKETP